MAKVVIFSDSRGRGLADLLSAELHQAIEVKCFPGIRLGQLRWMCEEVGAGLGWVEWGFYALSASKAIFRARTYNCN